MILIPQSLHLQSQAITQSLKAGELTFPKVSTTAGSMVVPGDAFWHWLFDDFIVLIATSSSVKRNLDSLRKNCQSSTVTFSSASDPNHGIYAASDSEPVAGRSSRCGTTHYIIAYHLCPMQNNDQDLNTITVRCPC